MSDLDRLVARARLLPPSAGTRAFARIRRVVLRQLNRDPENARLMLAMGVCWYFSPEESEERIAEAGRWLQHALELDASLHRAQMFLAHLRFDHAQYQAAIEALGRIPRGAFAAEQQAWRDTKKAELTLVCALYLGLTAQAAAAMSELLECYGSTPPEDRPIPIELSACLRHLHGDSGVLLATMGPYIRSLYGLTDLAEYETLHGLGTLLEP